MDKLDKLDKLFKELTKREYCRKQYEKVLDTIGGIVLLDDDVSDYRYCERCGTRAKFDWLGTFYCIKCYAKRRNFNKKK